VEGLSVFFAFVRELPKRDEALEWLTAGILAGRLPIVVPCTLLSGVVSLVETGGREWRVVPDRFSAVCGFLVEGCRVFAGRVAGVLAVIPLLSERTGFLTDSGGWVVEVRGVETCGVIGFLTVVSEEPNLMDCPCGVVRVVAGGVLTVGTRVVVRGAE